MAEMRTIRTTIVTEAIEDLMDVTDAKIEDYRLGVIDFIRRESPDGAVISVNVEITEVGDAQ